MKKFISLVLSLALLACAICVPVSAAEPEMEIISQETIYNDDGTYYVITLKQEKQLTRSGGSARGTRDFEYYDANGLAWVLTLDATFLYPGAGGGSATCTQATTSYRVYNGWKCTDHYAARNGSSAYGEGTFKKLSTKSTTLTIYCSPTGDIS